MKPNKPTDHPFLQALQGQIEPVRVGRAYRVALVLAAFAMVLLPLIYLALVAGVAYATYWYATVFAPLFEGEAPGPLFYYSPLIIGAVLILFMIKPLFRRIRIPKLSRRLEPQRQPLLFAFVEKIAQLVNAPVPRHIHVDCQVNASAHFHRGWIGFLRNDLSLTIGLPLAAGLNLQQFAAMVAHELGHFTQGTALRISHIIHRIHFWLTRVVFEEDGADRWLDRAGDRRRGFFGLVLLLSLRGVGLTRTVLYGLLLIGHRISGSLLRQMELAADGYPMRLAGSEAFVAMLRGKGHAKLASGLMEVKEKIPWFSKVSLDVTGKTRQNYWRLS